MAEESEKTLAGYLPHPLLGMAKVCFNCAKYASLMAGIYYLTRTDPDFLRLGYAGGVYLLPDVLTFSTNDIQYAKNFQRLEDRLKQP